MVSGRTPQEGHADVTNIKNKSQSSISIPTAYYYYQPQGAGEGSSTYFPHLTRGTTESGGGPGGRGGGGVAHRIIGPGHYHRTLSSSSLLNNKSVSKSRSDYCEVGVASGQCGGSGNNLYIEQQGTPSNSGWGGNGFRERRLKRESSQPIIIHVPITAPKATATTLSRATSPPPPQYLNSLSPERERRGEGVVGEAKRRGREDETKITIETKPVPPHLVKYFKNAPLKKVKHPLEENIFSSLVITLLAVGLALVIGIPVLCGTGALLLCAVFLRYSLFLLYGSYSYLHFICSNRHHLTGHRSSRPPQIFPRDRLAFANDVRWLGRRRVRQCQPILQTLLVFDGSMDMGSLRHLVQSRVIHAETPEGELAYPRLMHKVIGFPAGYKWELDLSFDIQNHIFAGPSEMKNEREIQEYLTLLLAESLPLRKPLWEIRVITNYGVQKDTLAILRVHQCLADGMTLVRILSHSLADQAQLHIPQRPHFAGLTFNFNVLRSLIVGPLTFLMWLLTTFRDSNLFSMPLRRKGKVWFGNLEPPSSRRTRTRKRKRRRQRGEIEQGALDDEHGASLRKKNENEEEEEDEEEDKNDVEDNSPSMAKKYPRKVVKKKKKKRKCKKSGNKWNVIWSAPLSVPKVSRVKQIMRSSLNDVLLSAAAGSVRQYMQSSGIPCPDDVKVVIPIDLRNDISAPKSSTKLGCKVASVLAEIPSGLEGAIPRLWATRHRLDELKASADPVVAYGASTVLMNILPHSLGVAVLDNITDKASLQLSNLPGPTHTLVVGGYPLKGIYPIYPPSGKIRVAITIFSYADQIHITIVSHRSLVNAGPSLLQGITTQVDQLSRQLSHRRVPGESRRSGRNSSMHNPHLTKPPRQIHMQLQVVQEELQQLSHRLDTPPVERREEEEEEENLHSSDESLGGGVPPPAGHLRTRLKTLKTEFTELMGELRRRSSIVEGMPMSFEDEECEEDYRKPRKRALSVVSMSKSRRNSLFSAPRSMTTPDSSVCYSSEEEDEIPSSSHEVSARVYNPTPNIRLSSSPIRTTAV